MEVLGYRKTIVLMVFLISFFILATPGWLLAQSQSQGQNQGVVVDQSGTFQFRQEIRPFVPLEGNLLLDPSRGEIILLFPKDKIQKIIQPEAEIRTQKKIFRKTNIKTQKGTRTGTVRSTTK